MVFSIPTNPASGAIEIVADTGFDTLSKLAIAGWMITLPGMGLWLYGYYATGHTSFIDWQVHSPWWIADLMPSSEAEIGMVLMCVGTVLTYWPPPRT